VVVLVYRPQEKVPVHCSASAWLWTAPVGHLHSLPSRSSGELYIVHSFEELTALNCSRNAHGAVSHVNLNICHTFKGAHLFV
jgi:hypothetical protein